MKKALSYVSLLIAVIMLLGVFASCGGDEIDTGETTSEKLGTSDTELVGEESSSETDGEDTDQDATDTTPLLEGQDAELIELAERLANGVQSGYSDTDLSNYVIQNKNMILNYQTQSHNPQLVTALTTKSGKPYIEDTMDVFVRMNDGKTYYASGSLVGNGTNIYRLGYYYYETRFEDQNFVGADGMSAPYELEHMYVKGMNLKDVKIIETKENSHVFEITDRKDPSVAFSTARFSTKKYQYIEVTLKANAGVGSNAELFVRAGGAGDYNGEQRVEFNISSDGQFHTYTIPIDGVANYTGNVRGVRVDINGAPGSTFEIAGIRALGIEEGTPGNLYLNRSFLTYSDKLHQIIQIAASARTKDIASVGMETKIDADKVEGIVVKDRQGLHYDLKDKIAWNTVQYVGFMIKDTGVFGYMMPFDGKGGNIKVTLENGTYLIEQKATPDGWTIYPSEEGKGNDSDFYMGQRIYTDTEKSFDKFIHEAECEVNPLGEDNFIVNPLKSGGATFYGYDSLHGYYRFDVDAAEGFRGPYTDYPNRHFGVEFNVRGDDRDRQIYVMTYTPQGSLECAAVLNEKRMLLPIPVEVAKNFKGDGENTIFMKDDAQYGETFIPLIVKANTEDRFTILNLYQNWGRFALKQISSIQYFSPYYHLSYGTTETNCLVPYGSNGLSLPDFRTMSAPIWSVINPQHNSCGSHSIVRYTNNEGTFIANQIVSTDIDSYGPTYADMSIYFISDDGKLKITYNHMEQPHSDENRSFFTLKIEVLDELNLENFKESFYFYSVKPNDPTGVYQRVGYLDTNNQSQVVAANKSGEVVEYVLGNECPYFSFFDMDDYTAAFNKNLAGDGSGYANVAMLIGNSEMIIGGEKNNAPFVLRDMTGTLRLTLDLGNTTLKVGDTLTIDGILLPWGSQELEGTYDELQDKNVRDVRIDSLLNPLKATAVENCETVRNSVGAFLPEVKSTNGKSATFTLSGGVNNNAVRIYGFDTLTVPAIEELVNGEWVTYAVSSIDNRDRLGYGYSYDGYNVFYDGDGTFSYSFVVNMDENRERTFRITAEGKFEGWGDEKDPTADLPLNVYLEPDNMAELGATLGTAYGCTYMVVEEAGERFFRLNGTGTSSEGYIIPYNQSPLYPTTGQYFVFKYRLPVSNTSKITYFDIFASTEGKSFNGQGDNVRTVGTAKKDGNWHVVVVDLSGIEKYKPNEAGDYIAKCLRFDALNQSGAQKIPETDYIDVAYFGFSDNLADICTLNSDMEFLDLYQESTLKKLYVATGETEEVKDPINFYFDPSEILNMTTGGCDTVLSTDGQYVRFSGRGSGEGYVFAYQNSSGSAVTGKYFVVKYRTPVGTKVPLNFQVYASTTGKDPTDANQFNDKKFTASGEWEIMVIDLSRLEGFNEAGGEYKAKHVRFDIINGKCTHTEESPAYVDVAYMGLHSDLNELLALDKSTDYITVVDNAGKVLKYNHDGSLYVAEGEDPAESETEPVESETEPVIPDVPDESGLNVIVRPQSFAKPSGCDKAVSEDGDYARFTAKGSNEAYIEVYKNPSNNVTGKYFFVKFRIPTGVTIPTNFQIYSSTQNTAAAQNGGKDQFLIGSILPKDSWQLVVVDLTQIATFTDTDGTFSAKYLRFDLINGKATHTEEAPSYIDVAFYGIHDSLVEILAQNTDIEQVQFVNGKGVQSKLPTDGSVKEPVEQKDRDNGDPLKVYATPDEIVDLRVRSLDKALSEDGKYFTYTAKGAAEGSVFVYENPVGNKVTGQYFVVKYRVPSDSASMPSDIEIFASTENRGETDGDQIQIGNFISDGEWHVMVIDLSRIKTFNEVDGDYSSKYIRLDIINGNRQNNAFVDVEYFAIHDDLNEIYALNADIDSIWYVDNAGKGSTITVNAQ